MRFPENIKKIIVRCPNWVGDIVMATPVYDSVRLTWPDAEIVGLVRNYAVDVLSGGPWFDRVVGLDDGSKEGKKQQTAMVKEFGPDVAIVLPNSWSSALPIWKAGCRNIYGYRRDFRGLILKDGPKPIKEGGKIKPMPTTDYYDDLCRFLGLKQPESFMPHLYIDEVLQNRADAIYAKHGIAEEEKVIGLNPGASFGSSKCWLTEYYAELAERLQDKYKCRLFMFTAPGEDRIADEIMAKTRADIIEMRKEGLDLGLLKPLINRCEMLVTNDTGPRHYAVAFDKPVAVIFGSTDPGLTASNLDKTATIRIDIECSPCQQKICPLGHHKCMKDLTVDMVFGQVVDLIEKHKQ